MTPRTTRTTRRAILLVALLAATMLAGCLADDPAPTANAPTTKTSETTTTDNASAEAPDPATTGTVRVEVVNADLDPIGDAHVAVAGRTSRTGPEGFAQLTGVPAGTHNLSATKDGWREGNARVTVAVGETAQARVKLLPEWLAPAAPPPENQTYTREFDFEGVFECSLVYLIIPGDCLTIVDFVDDSAGLGLDAGAATEEQNAFDFPLDRDWETVIVEQVWEPVIPGTEMQIALEPAEYDDPDHTPKYARVYGESPLHIRLENGVVHETADSSVEGVPPGMPNPDGGEVLTAKSWIIGEGHNAGDLGFLGVGFAYGQRFSVYVTVFYGEAAPDGYSRAPSP